MDQMVRGKVKAVYVMGENTVVSDPHASHAQHALESTEFMVVQDIFLTDTARLADVVLPAAAFAESEGTFCNSERRVQRVRPALPPPGEAKTDIDILLQLFNRMGLPQPFDSAAGIWDELRRLSPLYSGITYERLEKEGGLQWPCPAEDHPGTPYLHKDDMDSGLPGFFAPVDHIPPAEEPDADYPLVLTTGRRRSTYHTGTQTGRAAGFNLLVPGELVEINPGDADDLGITDGEEVRVSSRRGSVVAHAKVTDRSPRGAIFMSFAFPELTRTNDLTNNAYDFITETPEFKACAVKVERCETYAGSSSGLVSS
jgi:formate dehydrogenase major subunit/formate dehydrogenase alpha subunit